jgi:hypothetical protein
MLVGEADVIFLVHGGEKSECSEVGIDKLNIKKSGVTIHYLAFSCPPHLSYHVTARERKEKLLDRAGCLTR